MVLNILLKYKGKSLIKILKSKGLKTFTVEQPNVEATLKMIVDLYEPFDFCQRNGLTLS